MENQNSTHGESGLNTDSQAEQPNKESSILLKSAHAFDPKPKLVLTLKLLLLGLLLYNIFVYLPDSIINIKVYNENLAGIEFSENYMKFINLKDVVVGV